MNNSSFSDIVMNVVGLIVLNVIFFFVSFGVMFVPKFGAIISAVVAGFCGYYIAGFSAPLWCKITLGVSVCVGFAFALFMLKTNEVLFLFGMISLSVILLIGYLIEREIRSRMSGS